MGQDVLTLQEVAELLGKSTQTIRRMIKKGDLKAQRIKTAQGFQYGIYREQIAHSPALSAQETVVQAPSQTAYPNPVRIVHEGPVDAEDEVLTSQVDTHEHLLVTQDDVNQILENDFYVLEPTGLMREREEFQRVMDQQHREKMLLIHVLEALQAELRNEREKPQSFFAWIRKKLGF